MRISVARTLAMVVPSKSAAFYNKKPRATSSAFDPACRDCPRLAEFLDTIRREHPGYHARPVPPFGPRRAKLLLVGLAPGMHGANPPRRPFTGHHAGIPLYPTPHKFRFANHSGSDNPSDPLEP